MSAAKALPLGYGFAQGGAVRGALAISPLGYGFAATSVAYADTSATIPSRGVLAGKAGASGAGTGSLSGVVLPRISDLSLTRAVAGQYKNHTFSPGSFASLFTGRGVALLAFRK
jgi:hypothetical protein